MESKPDCIVPRRGRGILILDHHGFGNVVMSIPFLKAISDWAKGRWPVTVLINSAGQFDLIREEGLAIKTVSYKPRYVGLAGLVRFRADFRNRFDLIVGVPQIPVPKIMLLGALVGARHWAAEAFGWYRPFLAAWAAKNWTKPILQSQEELAAAIGAGIPLQPPHITLRDEERLWAKAVMDHAGCSVAQPVIGLHCSSTKESKRWPGQYFAETLCRLQDIFPRMAVVSFGSSNERADVDSVRRACGPIPWLDGTSGWSIRESLAVLSECDVVISGDTGIMHMAAAVGTKTVAVFGPTSPQRLAPRYNAGVSAHPEKSCHPCYRDHFRPCTCIRLVSPERVCALARCCLAPILAGQPLSRAV
jgi:ADP-heptose:LPS heptosyltransferase